MKPHEIYMHLHSFVVCLRPQAILNYGPVLDLALDLILWIAPHEVFLKGQRKKSWHLFSLTRSIKILVLEKNKRRVELSLCVNRASQRHTFLSLVHPSSSSFLFSGWVLRARLFFTPTRRSLFFRCKLPLTSSHLARIVPFHLIDRPQFAGFFPPALAARLFSLLVWFATRVGKRVALSPNLLTVLHIFLYCFIMPINLCFKVRLDTSMKLYSSHHQPQLIWVSHAQTTSEHTKTMQFLTSQVPLDSTSWILSNYHLNALASSIVGMPNETFNPFCEILQILVWGTREALVTVFCTWLCQNEKHTHFQAWTSNRYISITPAPNHFKLEIWAIRHTF